MNTTYPSSVRATEQVVDGGAVFAEPGEVGTVIDGERYKDGSLALTVLFPNAPRATTVFLGEGCTTAPTARA